MMCYPSQQKELRRASDEEVRAVAPEEARRPVDWPTEELPERAFDRRA